MKPKNLTCETRENHKSISGRTINHPTSTINLLGGGFNPFEKYARQIGSFPQVGVNTKNI